MGRTRRDHRSETRIAVQIGHEKPVRAAPRAVWVGLLLLGALLPAAGGALAQAPVSAVPVVTIDRPITPAVAGAVEDGIDRANGEAAPAVILIVETSSGTWPATDRIVRAIDGSDVPVMTFVPAGESASGPGAIVALAGQIVAMAPDARIAPAGGYATTASPFDDDRPAAGRDAELLTIAGNRGRPDAWVAAAVAGMTWSGTGAATAGLVDLTAPSVADLPQAVDGRTVETAAGAATLGTAGATTESVTPALLDRLWLFLGQPTVAYLLLALGVVGLLLEVGSPGLTLPGVAGTVALVLAGVLLAGMPLDWLGLALVAGGLALLIVDVFVPSLGVLTAGGLSAFVVGSYVLFEGEPGYSVDPFAIWTVAVCLALFFLLVAGSALRGLRRRPATGREAMVGRLGEVRTALAPEGMIFIDGEIWRAHAMTLHRTAAAPVIPPGTTVIVTQVHGLLLAVRTATAEEITGAGAGRPAPARRTVVPVRRAGRAHGGADRGKVDPYDPPRDRSA